MLKSVRELDRATAAAVAERRELAAMIGTMRGQRKQVEWLALTGAVALMVGLLLSPVVARLLPFGWDVAVATSILHTDRWNAAIALMKSTNPEGWATLASEMNLVEPNHAALTSCREAAARLKKSQSCAIVVPAP
jgi:chorismate mutase